MGRAEPTFYWRGARVGSGGFLPVARAGISAVPTILGSPLLATPHRRHHRPPVSSTRAIPGKLP